MQQKSLLTIIALIVSATTIQAAQQPCSQVLCASAIIAQKICVDEIVVKSGCGQCRTISAKDFMDAQGNLTKTVVIDEPGTWCLCEDVTFNPVEPGTPAIQILANDVLLDLKENTLRQINKDVSDTHGVQIGQGYNYEDPNAVLSNITITNGSIINFSGMGVFCYNGSFDGPVEEGFEQIPFESLNFTDLNILECGLSGAFDFGIGINLDSVAPIPLYIVRPEDPVAYSGVVIQNCAVNRCSGTAAISIYTVDNLVVEDTQANDTLSELSSLGYVSGYQFGGRNIWMTRCQGNGSRDLDSVFSSASAGILIGSSLNVYLSDCQFNDSFGENCFIVGNQFNIVENAVFQNCQFNNPRGGLGTILVNGVHMSDAPFQTTQGNGIQFLNCQFNGGRIDPENFNTLSFVAGVFAITVRNVLFEDCQACNITGDSLGHDAWGYIVEVDSSDPFAEFGSVRNVTFARCIASDISSAVNSGGGFFFGYIDGSQDGQQAHNSNMVINNCIAERIRAGTETNRCVGFMAGIDVSFYGQQYANGRNLYIKDCRAADIRSSGEQVSPLSAGIVVSATMHPVLKNNSVSDCDRGVLFTGSELITPDTLFQLSETFTGATAFTPVPVDLTSIPDALPLQIFDNLFEGNQVTISPSTDSIDVDRNYIFAPVDLNSLGWQSGSEILYNANGGQVIGGLVDGQIYYLIVYVPGYTRDGVVMNNTVDNCDVAGYQDDAPTTSSAWVNNLAFNNGTPASESANYEIIWSGTAPVYAGDLANYPTGSAKAYNLSLIP